MVLILDSTEMDLGKHAYSQMKDFGVDAEVDKIDALDAPRRIANSDDESVLFIFNTGHRFAGQILGKVLDLEEDKHVEKVFFEDENRGREVVKREAKSQAREKAEKLAEEVN